MNPPAGSIGKTKRPCESVRTVGKTASACPSETAPGRNRRNETVAPAMPWPESVSRTRPAIMPVPVGGALAPGGACWACAIAVKTAPATARLRRAAPTPPNRCAMGRTVGGPESRVQSSAKRASSESASQQPALAGQQPEGPAAPVRAPAAREACQQPSSEQFQSEGFFYVFEIRKLGLVRQRDRVARRIVAPGAADAMDVAVHR